MKLKTNLKTNLKYIFKSHPDILQPNLAYLRLLLGEPHTIRQTSYANSTSYIGYKWKLENVTIITYIEDEHPERIIMEYPDKVKNRVNKGKEIANIFGNIVKDPTNQHTTSPYWDCNGNGVCYFNLSL